MEKEEKQNHGLIFWIGNERYAIDIANVEGVIENKRYTPIPGVPPFVKGVINIRGKLMVLIDLRILLGGEDKNRFKIILSKINGKSTGLVVDDVEDIIKYDKKDLEPLPVSSGKNEDIFVGLMRRGEEIIILLNEEKIISDIEVET